MANYTIVAQVSKHMVTQWPKNHESYPAPYHHFESMTSKRMTLGHILSLGTQPSLSFNQPTAQIPRPSWPHAALVGNIFCRWVTGDHKRCQMSSPIWNTSYDFVIPLRHRAIADFSLKHQEHPRTSKNILPFYLSCHEGTLASGVPHIFYTPLCAATKAAGCRVARVSPSLNYGKILHKVKATNSPRGSLCYIL